MRRFFGTNPDVLILGAPALFGIKNGYRENLPGSGPLPAYQDDPVGSQSYQVKVYGFARKLIEQRGFQSVLDIGCGYGYKLKKFILPVCRDITGVDSDHAVGFLRRTHDFGQWHIDDIEKPAEHLGRSFDLILAVDVIEHLVNPDHLFTYIRKYAHPASFIIISTPERDRVHGRNHTGPPKNPYHIREWNREEFRRYVAHQHIYIHAHRLVGERWLGLGNFIRSVFSPHPFRKVQFVVGQVMA